MSWGKHIKELGKWVGFPALERQPPKVRVLSSKAAFCWRCSHIPLGSFQPGSWEEPSGFLTSRTAPWCCWSQGRNEGKPSARWGQDEWQSARSPTGTMCAVCYSWSSGHPWSWPHGHLGPVAADTFVQALGMYKTEDEEEIHQQEMPPETELWRATEFTSKCPERTSY